MLNVSNLLVVSSESVLLLATRLLSTVFSLVAAKARASIPEANCSLKEEVLVWREMPAKSEDGGVWQ